MFHLFLSVMSLQQTLKAPPGFTRCHSCATGPSNDNQAYQNCVHNWIWVGLRGSPISKTRTMGLWASNATLSRSGLLDWLFRFSTEQQVAQVAIRAVLWISQILLYHTYFRHTLTLKYARTRGQRHTHKASDPGLGPQFELGQLELG